MIPLAYLPCDDRERDFDRQLTLAARLLAEGLVVILGQRESVERNASRTWPGVIVDASDDPEAVKAEILTALGDNRSCGFLDHDPGWDWTDRPPERQAAFAFTTEEMLKRFREIASGVRSKINIKGCMLDESVVLMRPL